MPNRSSSVTINLNESDWGLTDMMGAMHLDARRHHPDFDTPYDAYHRFHKRFVGPATADKLVEFYDSLSEVQRPREMFVAGWAAAEASLVGTHYDPSERSRLAQAATQCWQFALELEAERASESAWLRDTAPDCTDQYRIASTLALAPIIEAIPRGIVPKSVLRSCQESLLDAAELNDYDMDLASRVHMEGRVASHLGLAFEQIATLGVNRMMSSRIVSLFSLARAGTGFHYPQQTHDVMTLNLAKNNIIRVTPTEVKSQLRVKFSNRYEAALVGGKALVGEDKVMIGQTLDMMRRELQGDITPKERQFLDSISESIIHSIRHHHRAEQVGRHCLTASKCKLVQPNIPLAS